MTTAIQKQEARFVHLPAAKNHGGRTIAYFRQKDQVVVGVSYCHENDTYNRKEGSNRALERLNMYCEYGPNGERNGLTVTRGKDNKVHAFAISNKEVTGAVGKLLADLSIDFCRLIDSVYTLEASRPVMRDIVEALFIDDYAFVTHQTIESLITFIVHDFR